MKNRFRTIVALGLALTLSGVAVAQLEGLLKAALKIGGVALVASKFGPDIDKSLNKLTRFEPTEKATTKVVPILSVGQGGYAGLAQVMGAKSLVDKVQAVAQVEGDFAGRVLRLRGLIPVSTKDIGKGSNAKIDRVAGVGVSAIIDIKL